MIRIIMPFLVILTPLAVIGVGWVFAHLIGSPTNAEKIDALEDILDAVEAELFDHLQALEPRTPYEPPPRWPLAEEEQEVIEVQNADGEIIHLRTR